MIPELLEINRRVAEERIGRVVPGRNPVAVGMRFPRNQTSRVELLNRDRSSADIPVCGFWRLSSRQSARRQSPVRFHRHGTRMSREPADKNVRATRFKGRAVVTSFAMLILLLICP